MSEFTTAPPHDVMGQWNESLVKLLAATTDLVCTTDVAGEDWLVSTRQHSVSSAARFLKSPLNGVSYEIGSSMKIAARSTWRS